MSDSVAVVWDDSLLGYTMGGDHPLHPVRLDLTMRLADSLGVLADRPARAAHAHARPTSDLLTLVHDPAYLEAVRRAPTDPGVGHGLGTAGQPDLRGHVRRGGADHRRQRARRPAGARAARPSTRSTSPAACTTPCATPPRASASSTTPRSRSPGCSRQGYERIAYVDLDVHHGDGVQAAFYDDPRVLTVSVHQTPLTLFPGTGFPEETGDPEKALGSAVNLALPNGTDDSAWLRAFTAVVPSVLRAFQPQILVTQCGCDAHHEDPLADLALTVDGQRASYRAMHDLAHEICDGRWIVLGGGGYGLVRCVPAGLDPPDRRGQRRTGSTRPPRSRSPGATTSSRRGLRARPPTHMTEGGYTGFSRWDPFTESRVDRAIMRTRRATFPYFGLDPDDPRD